MSKDNFRDDDEPNSGHWWLWPILVILVSHYIVDTYSATIPPLLGVVQTEFGMKAQWAAVLLGFGSICSGMAQPVFAWLSDRWNTRVFAGLGLLLAALGITFLGFAANQFGVFVYYAVGMMGVGMFHPISVSTIGRLAGDKRGLAISWFFVFGMGGFFTGSLLAPFLATGNGSLKHLAYMVGPGIVVAVILHLTIQKTEHKPTAFQQEKPYQLGDYDWRSIAFLYFSAVFRFLVNTALVYLLVRWMENHVGAINPTWSEEQIADRAAPLAGYANATMIVGQGFGGLVAGALIVSGREKWPMFWVPILFAPSLVALAYLAPGFYGYAACFLAGIGFAAMTPVTISVAQQMMPGHTSLASGIALGGAWAIASSGPRIAELLIQQYSLKAAFLATAVSLILAGLLAAGIRTKP